MEESIPRGAQRVSYPTAGTVYIRIGLMGDTRTIGAPGLLRGLIPSPGALSVGRRPDGGRLILRPWKSVTIMEKCAWNQTDRNRRVLV